MEQLLIFINQPENSFFLFSLILMIGIGLLEIALTFFGATFETLVADFDGVSSKFELFSFGEIFAWINQGRVPFIFNIINFLTIFGLLGLGINSLAESITGSMLNEWISFIPILIISLPIIRYLSIIESKILPRDETTALNHNTFIGNIATIVIGSTKKGKQAEAKFIDRHNQTHYFQVEAIDDNEICQGETVLIMGLFENKERVFSVVKDFNTTLLQKEESTMIA